MNHKMDEKQFIRNFKFFTNGAIDVFLGAGASFSSGIATGAVLVWYFKREIYCIENGIRQDKFKDLNSETNKKILQDYFDSHEGYPKQGSAEEYSFYFEKCFSSREARKNFIDSQVVRKTPSIGYLSLANLVICSKVNNIWTTNFDELLEVAIRQIDGTYPFNVCSSANQNSFADLNPKYSCIFKLHGDYRYDKLQNTTEELKELEDKIGHQFVSKLLGKGLLVIGYSGSDESVMSTIEQHLSEPRFLSKGLFWTTMKGKSVSSRVLNIIDKLNSQGKTSSIIEIENFDLFMLNVYYALGNKIDLIDKQVLVREQSRKLLFNLNKNKKFIKLNAFKADKYPLCNVFETDIKDWATLKQNRGDLIASLFNGCVYSFATTEQLKEQFKGHINSEIILQEVGSKVLYRNDSVYTGMLYDLIGKALEQRGLTRYKKSKFYDFSSCIVERGFIYYDAIDICLEFIEDKYYLNVCPTTHITNLNGVVPDKFTYQKQLNYKSNVYNKQYDEKLRRWQAWLITNKELSFNYNGFTIRFNVPAVSCGGVKRAPQWDKFDAFSIDEPFMLFSNDDKKMRAINQLRGLIKYGPIDQSFSRNIPNRPPIRLGVIVPDKAVDDLLLHLNLLSSKVQNNSKDKFLPNYEGFLEIYKRALTVPIKSDTNACVQYNQDDVYKLTAKDFVNFLKREIDKFALNRGEFDILIIYIPNAFKKFRTAESISLDFDLHDALKLYATDKKVTLQFIEEKSVRATDKCKVLWGLSTALYAKASMGVLWHPQAINDSTAYIGISYAVSKEKKICIGCSQLFDSTGTGMRMLLRKLEAPIFAGKNNPYMGQEEARCMMSALREEYYRCNPTAQLDRIVIHKTTPFMREEILGFAQAFEGIANIELIQIQEFNHWKGIKYGLDYDSGAEIYPLDRGTVIHISEDSFLLWTHGCLSNSELGSGHYYKNGRGIPTPLVVKRYYGNSSGDILAKEILMLTKMNWNSGDSLYKVLPVTLDFAKVLSRMSKQNEAIYNKAYDFRYFM